MALQDYRLIVNGLYGGTLPWSFSMRMTSTSSESSIAATLDSAVNVLWTTGTDGIAHLTNADTTLEGSTVATLSATQHELSKTFTARHVAGSNANPSLPWDNAVVVGFTGPNITKADRGRIRLPAPSVDAVGAHVYTPTFTAHLKVVLDVFFPAVRAGAGSYYSANALQLVGGEVAYTHHSLQNYHVSNKPGILKRRVNKVVPTFTTGTL
jgi:hypothetical protein